MVANKSVRQLAEATFVAQGLSPRKARSQANELVDEAERATRGEPGEYSGKVMLERIKADNARYDALVAEGVTDADIRWYFDVGAVYRYVIDKLSEVARFAHFIDALEKAAAAGHSKDEAAAIAGARVRQFHAIYGDPRDPEFDGDHLERPLYPELKDRVDREVERRAVNPDAFRAELNRYPTFNAWFRSEVMNLRGAPPGPVSKPSSASADERERATQLAQIDDLHRTGVLSEDEAEVARSRLADPSRTPRQRRTRPLKAPD